MGGSDYDATAAEAYERLVEPLTGAFADALLAAANRPLEGLSVLDCACGSGAVTLCAEARGAIVTACDVSAAMVARCAERSHAAATVVADIKAMPSEWTGAFDVAVSSFGVIFCGDLVAGLREMVRCLKPGGTLLFSAWGDASETPGFQVIPTAARAVLPPALADIVNPLKKRAAASSDNLIEAMREAMGGGDAARVQLTVVGPEERVLKTDTPAAYWTRFAETSPGLRS